MRLILPFEVLEEIYHNELVVAQDQYVPETIIMGYEEIGKRALNMSSREGFVNGFDLLYLYGTVGNIHGPAVAVFVALLFPDQLSLHLG
jgi:hypothetical protein